MFPLGGGRTIASSTKRELRFLADGHTSFLQFTQTGCTQSSVSLRENQRPPCHTEPILLSSNKGTLPLLSHLDPGENNIL